MNKKQLLALFISFITISIQTFAQDATELINRADEAFKADRVYSESTMTVYRNGRAHPQQTMETFSAKIDGKNHSLTVYKAPARLKGTAYLMIEEDLWVRFSTTGRVRKMSSLAKNNSASGSDFSYTDLGDGSGGIAEKYNSVIAGEAVTAGIDCYLIELTPAAGEDAPYEKIRAYISKKDYRYMMIEYFDAGAKIKTMILDDYRDVSGIFYPFYIEMKSDVKNSRTVIETSVMEVGSSRISERIFSASYLESMR